MQRNRIQEAINTGAEYLITACSKCLAHFNCYLNEHGDLKDKIKVIDLVSFINKLLFLIYDLEIELHIFHTEFDHLKLFDLNLCLIFLFD